MAKRLGCTQQAVSKLIKLADWPVRKAGPWSAEEVEKVRRWRGTLREDRSAQTAADAGSMGTSPAGPDLRTLKMQADIIFKQQQSELTKLRRQMLEQERVTREQFEGALGGLASVMVEVVEGWRLAIPARCPGVDLDALNLLLDAGLKRLADTAEVQAKSVDEVVAAARKARRGRPRS